MESEKDGENIFSLYIKANIPSVVIDNPASVMKNIVCLLLVLHALCKSLTQPVKPGGEYRDRE
jgi:hypothetical protein